jgi:hypothetical protein
VYRHFPNRCALVVAAAAGALCDDFAPQDLVLLLMANAGLLHRTAEVAPEAWHRFVGLDSVQRAMRQHGDSLGYG